MLSAGAHLLRYTSWGQKYGAEPKASWELATVAPPVPACAREFIFCVFFSSRYHKSSLHEKKTYRTIYYAVATADQVCISLGRHTDSRPISGSKFKSTFVKREEARGSKHNRSLKNCS